MTPVDQLGSVSPQRALPTLGLFVRTQSAGMIAPVFGDASCPHLPSPLEDSLSG